MAIHQTINPEEAQNYQVVPKWFRFALLVLTVINLIGTLTLVFVANDNYQNVQALKRYERLRKERDRATDEMLLKRATVQQFSYNMACRYAKQQNLLCLENPQWWADPNNYPDLVTDPSGTGLFPKEK